MKKHSLWVLIFFTSGHSTIAQTGIIDSLKLIIGKARPDTIKVQLLHKLADTYRDSPDQKNRDSAIHYSNLSLQLARSLRDKRGEVRSLIIMGKSTRYQTNPVEAIKYFQQALRISEEIKDTLGMILGLRGYAILYYHKNDLRQELSYYLQVEKLAKKINNLNELRTAFGLIGKTYMLLDQPDSAEYYLQRALTLNKDNDAYPISMMGNLKLYQHDHSNALSYFQKALAIYLKTNDKFRIAKCYYDIGRLYEVREKLDSAVRNFKLAFEQGSLVADSLYTIEGVGYALAQVYEKMNNLPEALRYYKLATAAKESSKNEETLSSLLNLEFQEKERKREIEAARIANANKIKLFVVLTGLGIFAIISFFLYRVNRNKKKANDFLENQKKEIEHAYSELKQTQAQLIQSEKMASLGELTAGIAHEIQNPLNFVNNFSEVNSELIAEMKNEINKGNLEEVKAIVNDIAGNEEKINHHGKRADAIVKSMLHHSRSSSGQKEPTAINALVDEYLRLAYHGLRAKDKTFNATLQTDYDKSIGTINIIPQEIGRVILNLITNAFYAVNEKKKRQPGYEPIVTVTTSAPKLPLGRVGVMISIRDNGNGIPQKVVDKIFQPFFTTKPTGQGTGLGLSLAYDIVKAHGGEIKVETKEGEGSKFIVQLPFV